MWGSQFKGLLVCFLSYSSQAAAYQPFFRAHAHLDTRRREPHIMDKNARQVIRLAVVDRYAWLPYWYTCFWRASYSGVPVMRLVVLSRLSDQLFNLTKRCLTFFRAFCQFVLICWLSFCHTVYLFAFRPWLAAFFFFCALSFCLSVFLYACLHPFAYFPLPTVNFLYLVFSSFLFEQCLTLLLWACFSCRPLWVEYPKEKKTFGIEDEYLIGEMESVYAQCVSLWDDVCVAHHVLVRCKSLGESLDGEWPYMP